MGRDPRYLNVNEHTKICGEHFVIEDYLNPYSVKKRLKDDAVPSIFARNKDKNQYKKRRSVTEKLEAIRTEEDEATDTASEGKGDPVTNSSEKDLGLVSRKAQTFEDDMYFSSDDHWRIPCSHKFSVAHLLSKCMTPTKEEKLFTQFTGFNIYGEFMTALQFLLPNLDRKLLIYWDSEAKKILSLIQKQCLMVIMTTQISMMSHLEALKYGQTEILFYKPRTCRILGEVSK